VPRLPVQAWRLFAHLVRDLLGGHRITAKPLQQLELERIGQQFGLVKAPDYVGFH
jgi:hypothetical protein